MLCPVIKADFDTASYHQFTEGNLLRRAMMRWFWDRYTTDAGERAHITAQPLLTSLDELAGLPPALVVAEEADVLGTKLRRTRPSRVPRAAQSL